MDQKSKTPIEEGSNIQTNHYLPVNIKDKDIETMSESEDKIRESNMQKLQKKSKKKNNVKLSLDQEN